MKIDVLKRASKLLKELESLREYEKVVGNKPHQFHFEFVDHNAHFPIPIKIPTKFNDVFVELLNSCIKEIEDEIKEI